MPYGLARVGRRFQEPAALGHGEAPAEVRRKAFIASDRQPEAVFGKQSVFGPGSSSRVQQRSHLARSLLPRPGLRAPHPCPVPCPTLEPCTLVQEPIPEPEEQPQVRRGSGDGHLPTEGCLLDITRLLLTSLASH